MQVRFNDNLGSRDGERLGVDFRQCLHGAEVDVPDEVAKRLIAGRFAVAVEEVEAQRPLKTRGVRKPDIQSQEPEASSKGEKKPSA